MVAVLYQPDFLLSLVLCSNVEKLGFDINRIKLFVHHQPPVDQMLASEATRLDTLDNSNDVRA